jgi:tRNA(fMet)-specific endonuclease VapC
VTVTNIAYAELMVGVKRSRDPSGSNARVRQILTWVVLLLPNRETSDHYAEIVTELKRAGTPIPTNDIWIAALCRQDSMALITNDNHFDLVSGLKTIRP